MFDFFRKDKGSSKPVVPDVPVAPPAAAPAGPPTLSGTTLSGPTGAGMLVEESEIDLGPEVEEAVMLYANGQTGEATAALNRFILNNPDNGDPLPWRLLFDIYEVTGQRRPFDDLAMDYAVRFEQSPPTWRFDEAAADKGDKDGLPSFAFGATFAPQDKAALDHFLRESATADTVALDLHATPVPDNEAYTRTLIDCMTRLAGSGKAIQLIGGEAFAVRLNASRADGKLGEPLWLLLLLLLQLQGKADEFENAAVDYAVQFEISPPSYTPPKRVASEPAAAEPDGPHGLVFPLRGTIGPAESALFAELRDYAMPLPGVEVDLAKVDRIDFMVVGLLMDTVMNLVQAGRHIVFKDGNEMVNLLLRMVGIGQFATIQPRLRK